MRSDERQIPPVPGTAPVGPVEGTPARPAACASDAGLKLPTPMPRPRRFARARTRSSPPRSSLSARWPDYRHAIVALILFVFASPSARAQVDKLPEGTITEIRFEGNATIPSDKIKHKLLSRVGQPLDPQKVNADLKSLMGTNWFSDVQVYYEESPPKSGKLILTFAVREMPILTHVEFRGRKAVRLKEIEDTTGLKVGHRADSNHTWLALNQILHLYQEKGYDLAEVNLIEGGQPGDTKVVIQIFEGHKVKISNISFVGCQFASAATLKTHISTRKPILGLFGKYHREMLDEDRQKLIDYYQKQGFFEVKVTPVTRAGKNPGEVDLEFVIHEGTRYTVRNLVIEGNQMIKAADLMKDMELHSGRPFLDAVRDADKNRILIKYNEIGCIDTQVSIEPKFTNQLGVVDLVYRIEEGEPYILGMLDIQGNGRTRDKVLRREAVQAGLLPGEVLDRNRIEIYRRRLMALGYFQTNPEQGKQIEIKIVRRRPKDKPYGDLMMPLIGEVTQARMQDVGPGGDGPPAPVAVAVPVPDPLPSIGPLGPGPAAPGSGLLPFGSPNPFSPPPDTLPAIEVPSSLPPALPGVRPGPGLAPPAAPPVGAGEPPATFPSIPGMNTTNVGPDRIDPFNNRSFADIVTSVEEAPTGRFLLGVGANSFQGLIGSVSIWEKNFDLFNIPRSFNDLINGTAFRGGGQEFRLNLQAGNLINMMQVSLREPYLFDLPIGAAATGYLLSRIYPNWDERRGGGRFSLGRQIGTSMYTDVAFRAEQVDFFGYRTPAPADYLAASGYTSVFSIVPSLRFDNRNNPFMATKGQYANFMVEQGWGSFTFSKFDAEGRMYIPTFSRPDGTGKQFFTLRGHFGIATASTPVYERYFAGNFGSLRGFQYRTVSPHAFGVPTGGIMMAVGSVEYQFPWNARDTFHQIVFTDFGTVTENYELSNMRLSVGTGLKVVIPAFGPLPLEFDLAFPLLHAYGDRLQYFNFTVGGFY